MKSSTSKPSFLADSLKRKIIFFTGKGGVGKTAMAWATALALQRQKQRVKVVSWSPFNNPSENSALKDFGIPWEQLDSVSCFKEYALKTLKFEKFFDAVFDNKILKAFIGAAPGLPETVIAGKVWDLFDRAEQDTLIVDLPATGHALSFFKSPMGIEKMFASGFVHRQAGQICDMFIDPRARLDIVTLPEEMPILETQQFVESALNLAQFPLGFLLVNQCTPDFPIPNPLPKELSREVTDCLIDHQNRVRRETLVLKEAHDLPLFLRKLPRFSTEVLKETIERLAESLAESLES